MRTWLALLWALASVMTGLAQNAPETTTRFRAVDVYVNSGTAPLAAYQIEFKSAAGNIRIAGVEGGEPAVFKEAPYYDAKAMQRERVIIAAFSTETENKLPKGKIRVATIHVQITGTGNPDYQVKLTAAADSTGRKIPAEASCEERKQP